MPYLDTSAVLPYDRQEARSDTVQELLLRQREPMLISDLGGWGCRMNTVSITCFRTNASQLLSDVERGEAFVRVHHGRPIAEVTPVSEPSAVPAWKRPALRLSIGGASLAAASLAAASLAERAGEGVP